MTPPESRRRGKGAGFGRERLQPLLSKLPGSGSAQIQLLRSKLPGSGSAQIQLLRSKLPGSGSAQIQPLRSKLPGSGRARLQPCHQRFICFAALAAEVRHPSIFDPFRRLALSIFAAAFIAPIAMQSQSFDTEAKPKSYIVFAAEPQTVAAGKNASLELHFRVQDGFHVNSHTPKSDLLIPTKLTMEPAPGVKSAAIEYPAGTAYSFSFDPNEKLDVYSGTFTVKVPVLATAGEHSISGALHYQACDHASCYPPKTLPVVVVFTAK